MATIAATAQAAAAADNTGAGAQNWIQQQGQNLLVQQMITRMGAMPQQQVGSKKQRELYVGNLMTGMVTAEALQQIFTQMFDVIPNFDKTKGPVVVNVDLNACGKYGFVEFRDETCAATAVKFAGINLYGRSLKIGTERICAASRANTGPRSQPGHSQLRGREWCTRHQCRAAGQQKAARVVRGQSHSWGRDSTHAEGTLHRAHAHLAWQ